MASMPRLSELENISMNHDDESVHYKHQEIPSKGLDKFSMAKEIACVLVEQALARQEAEGKDFASIKIEINKTDSYFDYGCTN